MKEILQNKTELIEKLKLILKISYTECQTDDEKVASKFIKINEEAFKCLKMLEH